MISAQEAKKLTKQRQEEIQQKGEREAQKAEQEKIKANAHGQSIARDFIDNYVDEKIRREAARGHVTFDTMDILEDYDSPITRPWITNDTHHDALVAGLFQQVKSLLEPGFTVSYDDQLLGSITIRW